MLCNSFELEESRSYRFRANSSCFVFANSISHIIVY